MKLYLSSFRVGDRAKELQLLASGKKIGFVPNALDHAEAQARATSNAKSFGEVRDLGLDVISLDLREFFGNRAALRARLASLGGVWVRGGNAFVLRQAMHLSGFDDMLMDVAGTDFLYGGYSAGVCVLAPRLEGLHHVDDPTVCPYPGSSVIWEGLGILDYLVLPHYKSDHPESANIDRDVEYCTKNGIPFRTLRDGEVIIEDFSPRSAA